MTALPLIIAGISLGGVLLFKKKDKKETPTITQQPQITKPSGSQTVRQLQSELNQLLPQGYPRLAVDGIWGKKTAAAFDKVMSLPGIDSTTKQRLKSVYYTIHGRAWQGKSTEQTVQIDPQKLTGNLTYPKQWYIDQANDLYNAMAAAGTDTFTIKKVFRQIKTKDDYRALITAFDYRRCNNCVLFSGGDLVDWLWREVFSDPRLFGTQKFIATKLAQIGIKLPAVYGKKNLYP